MELLDLEWLADASGLERLLLHACLKSHWADSVLERVADHASLALLVSRAFLADLREDRPYLLGTEQGKGKEKRTRAKCVSLLRASGVR